MKELCGTHYDYCNVSDPELKSVYNDESSDLAAGDSNMLFVQYATEVWKIVRYFISCPHYINVIFRKLENVHNYSYDLY